MVFIDLAVKRKLLLDSIDAWLLTQASLVDVEKRALNPVVRDRQYVADGLARYLSMLGLDRKAAPVEDLTAYIERRQREKAEADAKAEAGTPAEAESTTSAD